MYLLFIRLFFSQQTIISICKEINEGKTTPYAIMLNKTLNKVVETPPAIIQDQAWHYYNYVRQMKEKFMHL